MLTIHIGTAAPSPVPVSHDLYPAAAAAAAGGRDAAIAAMIAAATEKVQALHRAGRLAGVIAAGGGTGTHLATAVMRSLPLGLPKVMVSTVASRDMRPVVGTRDIVMFHSVADILGVNSVLGGILDQAAAAVCAMADSRWRPAAEKARIALSFFGFITPAAEHARRLLERRGYEVVAFHANGTGGMALAELAAEGFFAGILELATHELADQLKDGYCAGIGPERFALPAGRRIPRVVAPGGLDCAVLEFTRRTVPEAYRGRPIFFYDFRSAVRLDRRETEQAADQLAAALNRHPADTTVLIPLRGFSEADREGAPLHDPALDRHLARHLAARLDPAVAVVELDCHINEPAFAEQAVARLCAMLCSPGPGGPPAGGAR